ncbi:MAG: ribonuclease Z [Clostridia bacterium]|nr:ribonuclease Z [Clostridia bacterium]
MKITFIGTSHGVPAPDRYCSCIMIEVGSDIYFIDAGAPIVDETLRMGKRIEDIRAVFTTHSHGDHVIGLFSLCDLVTWYYRKAFVSVYATEEKLIELLCDASRFLSSNNPHKRLNFELVNESTVYSDKKVRVSYIKTKHKNGGIEPSYSILFEAEGRKLLFTGDLSGSLKLSDFPAYALENKTDLTVCEMAHFSMDHIRPYMEKTKTDIFCFTHVYPLDKYDLIEKEKDSFPYKVLTPRDGDAIEL